MLKLRALIVDDSTVYRHILVGVLESITGIVVTAMAKDGQEAIALVRRKHFDLVFLDVEMPVKDGLQTLREIRRIQPSLPVIMVSGTNRETTDITIRALEAGAYDFIPKPDAGSSEAGRMALRQQIIPLVRGLLTTKEQATGTDEPRARRMQGSTSSLQHAAAKAEPNNSTAFLPEREGITPGQDEPQPALSSHHSVAGPAQIQALSAGGVKASPIPATLLTSVKPADLPLSTNRTTDQLKGFGAAKPSAKPGQFRPNVLVIGVSTGGPAALMEVIPRMNGNLGIPVLIVQHMPPNFTASLADSLNEKSRLTVVEAQEGQILEPNTVYIAPGGDHMTVVKPGSGRNGITIHLNQNPPQNNCRPSVDVLFASVARAFGRSQVLSLVMTGMGRDGAEGVAAIKQNAGNYCLTQSADSCVVYGMPRAVDEAGLSDERIPLKELANRINQLTGVRIASLAAANKGATE